MTSDTLRHFIIKLHCTTLFRKLSVCVCVSCFSAQHHTHTHTQKHTAPQLHMEKSSSVFFPVQASAQEVLGTLPFEGRVERARHSYCVSLNIHRIWSHDRQLSLHLSPVKHYLLSADELLWLENCAQTHEQTNTFCGLFKHVNLAVTSCFHPMKSRYRHCDALFY